MKLLIVRFSSIGDIVLTTPVLRAIREQLPDAEIHFLTKKSFQSVLANNTAIDRLITIEKSIDEVVPELKNEEYDWVIDLHNNLRTKSLKTKLKRPYKAFPKLNIQKWLLVNFKWNRMPDVHVVDRYFEAVRHLGVKPNGNKSEFPVEEEVNVHEMFNIVPKSYVAMVVGAKFATKQLPKKKVVELIDGLSSPVILLGGPEDVSFAEQVVQSTGKQVINAVGKLSLQGSASVASQAMVVVTNDTGMMHISSAFDVPIVSLWGNTVPELGMYPYRPNQRESFVIHEVKGLSCRPCSKIGYEKCPKGHFKCMNDQNIAKIQASIQQFSK